MLLPHRKMNRQRYEYTEDRIDMTLYECFYEGKLAEFYETEDCLYSWIKREKLEGLFCEGEISKDRIKWMAPKDKFISKMKSDEIYAYLNKAISFINSRKDALVND